MANSHQKRGERRGTDSPSVPPEGIDSAYTLTSDFRSLPNDARFLQVDGRASVPGTSRRSRIQSSRGCGSGWWCRPVCWARSLEPSQLGGWETGGLQAHKKKSLVPLPDWRPRQVLQRKKEARRCWCRAVHAQDSGILLGGRPAEPLTVAEIPLRLRAGSSQGQGYYEPCCHEQWCTSFWLDVCFPFFWMLIVPSHHHPGMKAVSKSRTLGPNVF
nr:uncharacterized protein LOC105746037 [Dasypus novemcinctus]